MSATMLGAIAENVISYINSFVILDYVRERYRDHTGAAVVTVLIITIVAILLIRHVAPHLFYAQGATPRGRAPLPAAPQVARLPEHLTGATLPARTGSPLTSTGW